MIVLDLLLTVVLYMLVPFCIRCSNQKQTKKSVNTICLLNSVIVSAIFYAIEMAIFGSGKIFGPACVTYYFINKALLKCKIEINQTKKEENAKTQEETKEITDTDKEITSEK